MNKPMYCPLSFSNSMIARDYINAGTRFQPMECTPECAWAVTYGGDYACAIALECERWNWGINSRELKDGAE